METATQGGRKKNSTRERREREKKMSEKKNVNQV